MTNPYRPGSKSHAIAQALLEAHERGEWPDADHVAARHKSSRRLVEDVRVALRPVIGFKGDRTAERARSMAADGMSLNQIRITLRRSGTRIKQLLEARP